MENLYYSIGDVSKLVNEEKYILRYWESEFAELCPKKNSAGNRSYTDDDIQVIRSIQELLRNQQMALKDAKEILPTMRLQKLDFKEEQAAEILTEIAPEATAELAIVAPAVVLSHSAIAHEDKGQIIILLKEIKSFLLS